MHSDTFRTSIPVSVIAEYLDAAIICCGLFSIEADVLLKHTAAALACAMMCLTGCSLFQTEPASVQKEPAPQPLKIDGGSFVPPPPTQESSTQKTDEVSLMMSLALRDTERGKKAAQDMDLTQFWRLMVRFSKVSGRNITPKSLPETHKLLMMTWRTARIAAVEADKHYPRKRPWVDFFAEDATCRPDLKAAAALKDSFASSFTTRIWSVALALSAVLPSRADAIVREAEEITTNRWICGLAWKSDVEAGRVLGSAVYSKLSGEPYYLELLRKARAELLASRSK